MPIVPGSVDPVATQVAVAAVSIVFLAAALQKLRALAEFRGAVAAYRLLPESAVTLFSYSVPVVEIAAAAGLLSETLRPTAGGLLMVLLAVFAGAIAINLLRGRRDIDCGCGGPDSRQTISWGLVARNGVMAGLVLVALAEGATRELVWMDYLTVAAGTLALLGLYASANRLLANQPRLEGLRS